MRPLDELLPRIMSRAPECPEPVVVDAIRVAAQRFCERTRMWRESDQFTTSDDGLDYVCAPYGAVLHEIESARFNGNPLEPVSIQWLNENIAHWRTSSATLGRYITQTEPDSVRVIPAANGSVELTITLKPSDEADELPDFLVATFRSAIIDGALAEVLTVPEQRFTNPDLAGYHAQRFERELVRLSNRNVIGQQRAPARTVPHFF